MSSHRCIAVAVVVATACGPRAPRPSGDRDVPWARAGIDWATPPAIRDVAWLAPPVSEAMLANGVRIVVVENHRLPLVAFGLLHGAAGSREDAGQPGVAALTADMLDEGAGTLDALRFARALAGVGAELDIAIATDHAVQHAVAPSRELGPALALLADSVRRPTMDEREVARVRTQRLVELVEQRAQTRRSAAQVFDRVVFGAHPYATPAEGTAASVAGLTAADVRAFWRRAYRPDALTVIAVGDTTLATVREHVEATFGDWPRPGTPLPAVPALPAYSPRLGYVDVPGAREVNVIVGRRAAPAGDVAADVANLILGAGVDGRLDDELHDKLALSFGASSSFWRGTAASSWAASATFDVADAPTGIRALLTVLETATQTEPSADELARARRDLSSSARQAFDTSLGGVRAIQRLVVQRLPLAYYATLAARLDELTGAQVRDALPLTDLSIVVVGDWSRLGDALASVGLSTTPYQP